MNRVRFLCKLFESHHFCLYLRHIWVLLTSLLHCVTWKCKKSLDRKNKFTSKILFFLPCAQHDLLSSESGLKCILKGHTKSSHESKILTSEAKKDLSSVLSPKKYGKGWGKNLWRWKLLKHNFLGFKLNCVSREIRHWPTLRFCNFICDRSKNYYSNLYTLQKYYYLWKCKLVKCI